MARFIITTVSPAFAPDGSLNQPETAVECSQRESRAIKKARAIRATGNFNVMLFKVTIGGRYIPISLKHKTYTPGQHSGSVGHNHMEVGIPFEGEFYRTLSGRVHKLNDYLAGNTR